jgi:O-antigen ligase
MQMQAIRNLLNLLLTALIAAIPLVSNSQFSDPTLLPRQFWGMGICGVLGLILVFSPQQARQSIALQFLSAVLLLACLYIYGIFDAHNPAEALATTSRILLMLITLLLLIWAIKQETIPSCYLLWGISLSAAIGLTLLIIEITQLHQAGTALWQNKNLYQLRSAFGHKNLYSSYQLFCLPFILILFRQSKAWQKILLVTLLMAILLSLVLVQTKAVLLAIFLSLSATFLLALVTGAIGSNRTKKWMAFILVGTLVLAAFLLWKFPEKAQLLRSNDTVIERYLLWSNSLQMLKEQAWLGVGPGNWQVFFPKYGLGDFMQTNYLISDGFTTFQRPHNDFLWIACEVGMIGLIVYLFIIFYAFKDAYQQRLQSINYWFLMAGIIAYAVVAAVDFPLERNEHQLLFALLLAFALKPYHSNKLHLKWLALPLLAGFLFILSFGLNRMTAEKQCKQLLQSYQAGNYLNMQAWAKEIDQNYLSIDNYSIPVYWYQGLALYAMGRKDLALIANQKAYEVNPYQIHVINNLAGMYHENDSLPQALKLYQEVLAISPTQPDAILNSCAVYFNLGQTKQALKALYAFKFDKDNTQFQESLFRVGNEYFKTTQQIDLNLTQLNRWFVESKEKGLTFEESIKPLP